MHSPKCGSDNKVNSGKVNPRQRYKCQQCDCNQTQSYQHGYRLDKKLLALQLYLQGNGLRGTGRILGLSNVTVLNWIQQFGTSIYRQKNENYGSGLRSTDWTSKSLPTPLAVAGRKPGKDCLAYSMAIAWLKWQPMGSRCRNKLFRWTYQR